MKLAALLLLFFAGLAHTRPAEVCPDDVEAALRAVDRKAEIVGDVAASQCRPWPPDPGRITAAVMAFEQPGHVENEREWVVVIGLVDAARGQALTSHRVVLEEDGSTLLGPYSLSLDLAPYLLKPGLRALGLRVSSDRNANAVNNRRGGALRLYVPQGQRLRPVFCQAMGWQDAGLEVIGQAPWDEATTTLSLAAGQTQGWRDLRLTEQVRRYMPDGESGKPTVSHRECRFADGVYRCAPGRGEVDTDCDPTGL